MYHDIVANFISYTPYVRYFEFADGFLVFWNILGISIWIIKMHIGTLYCSFYK